jgi:hypothetical protein
MDLPTAADLRRLRDLRRRIFGDPVRGADGDIASGTAAENVHEGGILATLDRARRPLIQAQVAEARALARKVAEALDYVGVLTSNSSPRPQGPVFNEMAPRVHNSGTGRSRARSPASSRTTSARSAGCRWAIPRWLRGRGNEEPDRRRGA